MDGCVFQKYNFELTFGVVTWAHMAPIKFLLFLLYFCHFGKRLQTLSGIINIGFYENSLDMFGRHYQNIEYRNNDVEKNIRSPHNE